MKLPPIFGLAGKAGAGKSTIAALLFDMIPGHGSMIKLAGPLYELQKVIYDHLKLPPPQLPNKDRRLLQLLGTDWGRSISNNFWIDRYYDRVKVTQDAGDDYIMTDDVRFNNEADFIKQVGGIVILIVGRNEDLTQQAQVHASEAGISMNKIDFIVDNSGSIEDTRSQIKELIRNI